jgi:hypothetical protein
MEYFIGFAVALCLILFAGFIAVRVIVANPYKGGIEDLPIRYSQSHIHELVSPLLPPHLFEKPVTETQAIKHHKNTNIRVIVLDNNAYWIKDHVFYMADMEQGILNPETTRVVDTMAMNKVQLDKMIFVVDRLTEGEKDDSGNSGNKPIL